MKIQVELNVAGESIFLNYWNWINGDDVVCEVKGGKLMLRRFDEDANYLPPKEITFAEFCEMVIERANVNQNP